MKFIVDNKEYTYLELTDTHYEEDLIKVIGFSKEGKIKVFYSNQVTFITE